MAGELEQVVAVGLDPDEHHRAGVDVLLVDDRVVDLLREPAAHPGDDVAHVLGGILDGAVEVEFQRDVGRLLGAAAGHGAEPLERSELLFQHVFRDADVRLWVSPAPGDAFDPAGWWRDEDAIQVVLTEYIKLASFWILGRS